MALTATYIGPGVPLPDSGQDGFERVRLGTTDGTGTSVSYTHPATAPGKRIMHVIGARSNIPTGGVPSTTAITITTETFPAAEFKDVLLFCKGA